MATSGSRRIPEIQVEDEAKRLPRLAAYQPKKYWLFPNGEKCFRIVGSVAPSYGDKAAADNFVFLPDAQQRAERWENVLTFALHMVPLGAATDNACQGNYSEAAFNVIEDAATIFGIGAAGKAGKLGKFLRGGAATCEAIGTGKAALDGINAARRGDTVDALTSFGDTALRLFGFTNDQIKLLRERQKVGKIAENAGATNFTSHMSDMKAKSAKLQSDAVPDVDKVAATKNKVTHVDDLNLTPQQKKKFHEGVNAEGATKGEKGDLVESTVALDMNNRGYEVMPTHYQDNFGQSFTQGGNHGLDVLGKKIGPDGKPQLELNECKFRKNTARHVTKSEGAEIIKEALGDDQVAWDNIAKKIIRMASVKDVPGAAGPNSKELKEAAKTLLDNLQTLERKVTLMGPDGRVWVKTLDPLSQSEIDSIIREVNRAGVFN